MSPEQIRDSDLIDHRADLWSIGVVLWNVLTGEWLFKGENDAATAQAIMDKKVVPPSETDAKPPAFFDEVVLCALERDPDARFSTALEMAEALRKRATENHMMGSRLEVAAWVEKIFGEDLERRRAAIREVVRRRTAAPALTEFSQVTVLSSLASPVKIISPDDKAPVSTPPAEPPTVYPEPGTASGGQIGKTRQMPLWLILTALVCGVLALVIVLMFFLRPPSLPLIKTTTLDVKGSAPKQPLPSPAVAPQPIPPPKPALDALPSEPEVEPKPAATRAESETSSSEKDSLTKTNNARRKSRSAERSANPSTETSQPANPGSNISPKAPTTSAPTDDFETNPYIRR
jgi:serine/threonine-protein kinase